MRGIALLATPLIACLLMSGGARPSAAVQLPVGWYMTGSHPQDYSIGVAKSESHGGKASKYLASTAKVPEGFGTLMQMVAASSQRGQRLRLSAYVKSEAVEGWAGLWMRVDGPNRRMLAFDNMQGRPVKGTSDWHRYDIVLDVPEESIAIAFGILLSGKGKVYINDVAFEFVPATVETTNILGKAPPAAPSNLAVEK